MKALHSITFLYGIMIANIFIIQHWNRATNKETVLIIAGIGFVCLFISFMIGSTALDKECDKEKNDAKVSQNNQKQHNMMAGLAHKRINTYIKALDLKNLPKKQRINIEKKLKEHQELLEAIRKHQLL